MFYKVLRIKSTGDFKTKTCNFGQWNCDDLRQLELEFELTLTLTTVLE